MTDHLRHGGGQLPIDGGVPQQPGQAEQRHAEQLAVHRRIRLRHLQRAEDGRQRGRQQDETDAQRDSRIQKQNESQKRFHHRLQLRVAAPCAGHRIERRRSVRAPAPVLRAFYRGCDDRSAGQSR